MKTPNLDADRWLAAYLPELFHRSGWHELKWWQWAALPITLGAGWALGKLFGFAIRRATDKPTSRHPRAKKTIERLGASTNFAFALVFVDAASSFAGLVPAAELYVERLLHAGYLIAVFWTILRLVDLGGDRLLELPQNKDNGAARSLVPLGTRAAKIVVFAMGIIAAMSELGYPVASLVAGLGIGGVALALAAQKTVENLFGSLALGVDQPLRVGDFVRVDDVRGTVESIGLRSTRIRTLDRTRVTIPNGKLADSRIESFNDRDRNRFASTFVLAHATSADGVRNVVRRGTELLLARPKVEKRDVLVQLVKVSELGLEIEFNASFFLDDAAFAIERQEVLLALLEIVEQEGSTIASPRRLLRLDARVNDERGDAT